MHEPLKAPPIRRRLAAPLRTFALLLALASLPVFVLARDVDEAARRSVLNVLVSFAFLMVAFRLLGKRELGRLSPFELVTLMLIPEILSSAVQGEGGLVQSLAGLCTILGLVLLTSTLAHRFEGAQKLMEASPTLLVLDGRLLEDNLNRERIAPDELLAEMRKQGLAKLASVRVAVLENSGNITFVPAGGAGTQRGQDDEGPKP